MDTKTKTAQHKLKLNPSRSASIIHSSLARPCTLPPGTKTVHNKHQLTLCSLFFRLPLSPCRIFARERTGLDALYTSVALGRIIERLPGGTHDAPASAAAALPVLINATLHHPPGLALATELEVSRPTLACRRCLLRLSRSRLLACSKDTRVVCDGVWRGGVE